MKLFCFIALVLLNGCSALNPDLFRTLEDIATDGVLFIQMDKEAFEKGRDVHVFVDVIQKN